MSNSSTKKNRDQGKEKLFSFFFFLKPLKTCDIKIKKKIISIIDQEKGGKKNSIIKKKKIK